MRKPTPITIMRIHPESSTLYAEVYVYKNLKDLRNAEGGGRHVQGWCKWDRGRSNRRTKSRRVSRVALAANRLGARIVAHEMTHAAFHYLAAKRVYELDTCDANERTCYLVGDMTSAFYTGARNFGLID